MRLTVEVPPEAFSALRRSPDEFVQELRIAAASKWYEAGLMSQERAAEMADCSSAEFLHHLARFQVTPFQTTAAELLAESQW
jgi:predicted HTH domain antitoxin